MITKENAIEIATKYLRQTTEGIRKLQPKVIGLNTQKTMIWVPVKTVIPLLGTPTPLVMKLNLLISSFTSYLSVPILAKLSKHWGRMGHQSNVMDYTFKRKSDWIIEVTGNNQKIYRLLR